MVYRKLEVDRQNVSINPVFSIPPVLLPMEHLKGRQIISTIADRVAVFPNGQKIVAVTAQRSPLAWLACLLALWLGGCAYHRGPGWRVVPQSAQNGGGHVCTSQELGSARCVTPGPPLRCRLWGVGCRLRGVLGDVRWLLREGIMGGPDQDIPPGPTPPPVLDEFFPLPTRPVFYPNRAPDRAEYADWMDKMGSSERGVGETPATGGHPSHDDSQTRSPAKDTRDTGVPDRAQPEVIPLPAPLPPGDSFEPTDSGPSGKELGRPEVWDSAGWRTAGGAGPAEPARGRRAEAAASDQGRALEAGGGPAWVFLPTAPVVANGPRVTVSSDSAGDRGRKPAAVRR